LTDFLHRLRQSMARHALRGLDDVHLLARFREQGEEAAFACLVERHGPMVLSVCRRVLGNEHEAEDAFQATFLVLFRKASGIRKRTSLPSWLHGVAFRIATKAGRRSAQRRRVEREAGRNVEQEEMDTATWNELRVLLDEEIQRLPSKLRLPLILCYLQEKTHAQAAAELGWPRTSVSARLAQAKELLHTRLVRRGVRVAPTILAGVLAEKATAAVVPAGLVLATVRLAAAMAAGKATTATVAVALAQGFLRGLTAVKLLLATAIVSGLGLGLGFVGAFALTTGTGERPTAPGKTVNTKVEQPKKKLPPQARLDAMGDPLPAGVVARMGSSRLRHSESIQNIVYSSDGKTIVSQVRKDGICLWDAATGMLKQRLALPVSPNYAHPVDNQTMVVAVIDYRKKDVMIQMLDMRAAKELGRFMVSAGSSATDVALAPGGKTVAYSLNDGIVHLVDATTGKEKLQFKSGEGGGRRGFAFSPDNTTLAVSDSSKSATVRFHDATDGKLVREFKQEGKGLLHLRFSPDGRFLAAHALPFKTEAKETSMVLFDMRTGKESPKMSGADGSDRVLAFSPDGKFLATSKDRRENALGVILWDLDSGKEVRRFATWDTVTAGAFSPDGKTLAGGNLLGTIALWDVASGISLPASAAPIQFTKIRGFAAGGKHLIGEAERFYLWETATGREVRPLAMLGRESWPARALSPDLTIMAAFGLDGKTIKLCDADDAKELRVFEGLDQGKKLDGIEGLNVPRFLRFSPDGRLLVSVNKETAQVWNVQTGQQIYKFPDFPTFWYDPIVFSADSGWLAATSYGERAGAGPSIRLWDLKTGKMAKQLTPRRGWAYALAFSPDGRFLAASTSSRNVIYNNEDVADRGLIQVWDLASGKEWRSFDDTNPLGSTCLDFSPDGRMLASCNIDGLHLWELATGGHRHVFKGHSGYVNSLAFLPNGRLLAAASPEAPVYIWDVGLGLVGPGKKLTAETLERSWADLAGEDAGKAYQALLVLASDPNRAVPFLGQHLKPVPSPDPKRIQQLVKDLESSQFAKRKAAEAELDKLADASAAVLRKAVQDPSSLEVRQRLEQILKGLERYTPDKLRLIRSVEALEWMGTDDALRLITELADGAPDAYLTREAIGARDRLRTMVKGS